MQWQSGFPSDLDQTLVRRAKKASLPRRFFAYFVDGLVLSLASWCLGLTGASISAAGRNQDFQQLWNTALGLVSTVLPLAYFSIAYSVGGQTVGKRLLKIRVVSIDGSPLGARKGIVRALGYIPSGLLLGIGFLWAAGDPDRQTWHDKMAGTCVVPESVEPQQLQGTIAPAEASRRQRRWLLGLGIPSIFVITGLVLAGLFFIRGRVDEVTAMGPWPGPEVSPEAVVKVDLSPLALEPGELQDARTDDRWSAGGYDKGSVLIYHAGSREVVAIWALRYGEEDAAAADYYNIQAQTDEPGVCGFSEYASWFTMGVVHCQDSSGSNKVFWNENWIVDIAAVEGTGMSSDVLVDRVRDAVVSHWRTLRRGAQW